MLKTTFKIILSYFLLTAFSVGAEGGGMPQLDPTYWISQIFWLSLTFGSLFLFLTKFILPNISKNLEDRKSKILENIETADKQKIDSEKKIREYESIILDGKNNAKNIINEAKKKILDDVNKKKDILDAEINKEIKEVEHEINDLKNKSPEKINQIAIETSTTLIKQLVGADANKSKISAIIEDISKAEKGKNYGI